MGPHRFCHSPQRWQFQHGPIDLIVHAEGEASSVLAAHEAAWEHFQGILPSLVRELLVLRSAVLRGTANPCVGTIARNMWQACAPFAEPTLAHPDGFITPMAAVAGAVAQAVLAPYQRPEIIRAWVNNGGDIALYLHGDTSVHIGLVSDLAKAMARQPESELVLDGNLRIAIEMPVRGVATSGWQGRSHSLGIADSVTVLAASAPQADAAATLIANAVDVEHRGIVRQAANQLRDDTDLGERLVTVHVPALSSQEVATALARGHTYAHYLMDRGLIFAALLCCQGQVEVVGGRGMHQ